MHGGDEYLAWHCRRQRHCYFFFWMHSMFIIHYYRNISCFALNVAMSRCEHTHSATFTLSSQSNVVHITWPTLHCSSSSSTVRNKERNNKQANSKSTWIIYEEATVLVSICTQSVSLFLIFFFFLATEMGNRQKKDRLKSKFGAVSAAFCELKWHILSIKHLLN